MSLRSLFNDAKNFLSSKRLEKLLQSIQNMTSLLHADFDRIATTTPAHLINETRIFVDLARTAEEDESAHFIQSALHKISTIVDGLSRGNINSFAKQGSDLAL